MDNSRNASVAVIGAGDFIGAAITRRFAVGGYAAFAGRRNGEKLAPLAAEIEAAGGRCAGRTLDARVTHDKRFDARRIDIMAAANDDVLLAIR